eukprot:481602-Prymnesium_polylepis.1
MENAMQPVSGARAVRTPGPWCVVFGVRRICAQTLTQSAETAERAFGIGTYGIRMYAKTQAQL